MHKKYIFNIFESFFKILKYKEPKRRWEIYKEVYFYPNEKFLRNYLRNYTLLRDLRNVRKIIGNLDIKSGQELRKYLTSYNLTKIVNSTLKKCYKLLPFTIPKIYLFIGYNYAAVFETIMNGNPAIGIALEQFYPKSRMAEKLNINIKEIPIWIAHEYCHCVRYCADDSESPIAKILKSGREYNASKIAKKIKIKEFICNEGISIIFSMRIINGFPIYKYLGFTKEDYEFCKKEEGKLWEEINHYIEMKGIRLKRKYFTYNSRRERIQRIGYFLGFKLINEIIHKFPRINFASLVRMDSEEIWELATKKLFLKMK